MALSADDRLLGEKVHNYCSSSEDEGGDEDGSDCEGPTQHRAQPSVEEPELAPYTGTSTNTGPKGVVNDWRRYKQLENEKRVAADAEKAALYKKLSLTCRSELEEQNELDKDKAFQENLEKELEMLEDEFMAEYRQKRIEEMRRAVESLPQFGSVIPITKAQYLDVIDKEKPNVTIVIHLFEDGVDACAAMNGCLVCLAQEYPNVKFCKIRASEAKLSKKFSHEGVPALLIYRSGEMIGNFIRLGDELGNDFYANDVENFLNEHGMLPNKSLVSQLTKTIRQTGLNEDDDSDLD